jgi:hypothetical protein
MPDRRAWFDVQKASLEQDTERLALFTKAISGVPMTADIEAALDNGESALVQAIGEEKGGSVQGIHVSLTWPLKSLPQSGNKVSRLRSRASIALHASTQRLRTGSE